MRKPAKRSVQRILAAIAVATGLAASGCSRQPSEAAAQAKPADTTSDGVSVMDLVEECDVLAAHPDDPQRMAEGVDDDKIVPRLAVLACEDAMKRQPDDPRFVFQLGRALLARGDKEKALTLFQESARKNYAVAYGYIGDAYQFGNAVPIDPAVAAENYKKAAAAGFEPAKGLPPKPA